MLPPLIFNPILIGIKHRLELCLYAGYLHYFSQYHDGSTIHKAECYSSKNDSAQILSYLSVIANSRLNLCTNLEIFRLIQRARRPFGVDRRRVGKFSIFGTLTIHGSLP